MKKKVVNFILLLILTLPACGVILTSIFALNEISPDSTNNYFSYLVEKNVEKISNFNFFQNPLTYNVFIENSPAVKKNKYNSIYFSTGDKYSLIDGVPCFRGNNLRDNPTFGTPSIVNEKLIPIWNKSIGSLGTWTGTGWTGQPAIVKWPEATKKVMNLEKSFIDDNNFKEVIYATLDGNIYFLDLLSGKQSRSPINVGFPHKGSLSVDPRGYPLLYAGQGIADTGKINSPFGFRIFSLIDGKMLYFIDGLDKNSFRQWGAFDSNALLDIKTDTLIECGENGFVYTAKLNTNFNSANASISITPKITKYRYKQAYRDQPGIENSVAIYKNLAFFTDNGGMLQSLDLNTLTPRWYADVTDDSDASIVLEVSSDKNEVFLYTGCEVDLQGPNGYSYLRKFAGTDGKLLWEKKYKCFFNKDINGGLLGTPIVGKKNISNLVIFNIAKINDSNKGLLVALDKVTGNEIWKLPLNNYSWSSPVAIYSKENRAYIILGDSIGNMYLINAENGKLLHTINLGSNIESSPSVYENLFVVGTRGQKIYGIKIE